MLGHVGSNPCAYAATLVSFSTYGHSGSPCFAGHDSNLPAIFCACTQRHCRMCNSYRNPAKRCKAQKPVLACCAEPVTLQTHPQTTHLLMRVCSNFLSGDGHVLGG